MGKDGSHRIDRFGALTGRAAIERDPRPGSKRILMTMRASLALKTTTAI